MSAGQEVGRTYQYDVVIAGAGAAGLLCAAEAVKRGRRVAVLERNAAPGRKILISGGGRCNFTNLHTTAANFLSANPHFAKSALARYTPADFIRLVEKHGIRYHEKKLGQLFCDGSAREIVRMLVAECAGADLVTNCRIAGVRRSAEFELATSEGEFRAPVLVVATGGLSIPKIGATGFGLDLARQFGLRVMPVRPALVPLTFDGDGRAAFADLAGVAADVVASLGPARFAERMLFTHRGLSGPAILQISSYWDGRAPVTIDLLPGIDFAQALAERPRAAPRNVLAEFLPKRLADRWWELHGGADIHAWGVRPSGTEGFDKAEVMAGGVDTAELSSKTMEARRVPGLFFIGETVDVTGHLGGFNFQWAWASGYAAGQAV